MLNLAWIDCKREYRTSEINSFILLLCRSIKDFSLLENEKATEIGGLSTSAPPSIVFSNRFAKDLERLYFLHQSVFYAHDNLCR